jgi:hemoglobin
MPGITALVDDFVNRVAADERINAFFAKADMNRLRKQLTDQFCQLAEGPCTYTGGDMLTVHKGMGISGDHFQAMMEDLIAALRHAKVTSPDEGALVGKLLPLRPDIVERP